MAEIKSSIQIAMERAAALGAGGGRQDEAREEGRRQGKVWGRLAATGQLGAQELAERLEGLEPDARPEALSAAAAELLNSLEQESQRCLSCLGALAQDGPAQAPLARVARLMDQSGTLDQELNQELARELMEDLAAVGISGSAVHPNPLAHPDLEARQQAALADLEPRRQAAILDLRQALGVE